MAIVKKKCRSFISKRKRKRLRGLTCGYTAKGLDLRASLLCLTSDACAVGRLKPRSDMKQHVVFFISDS